MSLTYRNAQKTQVIASRALELFSTCSMALCITLLIACAFGTTPAFAAKKTFTQNHVGKNEIIIAKAGDTFMNLAPEHGVGYAQLVAANPHVDPWLPGVGREIVLPKWHLLPETTHQGLILNTGELLLYYFPENGSAPRTFPIGIGREGLSTPMGTTTVTRKAQAPTWRPTPRMRLENPELPAAVPPGPKNPLGAYALYLGWPSYLIHGTDNERGIGRRASSGCIRMYRDSITWLYENVKPGTKLTSVNEPIKTAWIDGELYLEAEPNDLQIDELEYQNRQVTVEIPDGAIKRIRAKAGDQAHRVNWEIVRATLIERTGIPMQITHKPAPVVVEKKPAKEAVKKVEPKARNSDWDNLN